MAAVAAGLLVAGAAAPPKPDLLFQAEAQTLAGTCLGQPVRLEGNHNTVVLTGPCGSLLLKGYANTVRMGLASGATIHVEGSANRVTFTSAGAPPVIEVLGPDNEVTPGRAATPIVPTPVPPPPQAVAKPAPSPAMALAGDDQQRIADCAGRDVTVTGNRSAYILRGGCRSVTVTGNLMAVRAALAPGAKIAITGQGSIVTWSAKPGARAPVSVVRGSGSRVQRGDTVR